VLEKYKDVHGLKLQGRVHELLSNYFVGAHGYAFSLTSFSLRSNHRSAAQYFIDKREKTET